MRIIECKYVVSKTESKTMSAISNLSRMDIPLGHAFRNTNATVYQILKDGIYSLSGVAQKLMNVSFEIHSQEEPVIVIKSNSDLAPYAKHIEAKLAETFNSILETETIEVDIGSDVRMVSAKILGKTDKIYETLKSGVVPSDYQSFVSFELEGNIIQATYLPAVHAFSSSDTPENMVNKYIDRLLTA